MQRYLVPNINESGFYRVEQNIKRSRFICSLSYAENSVQAKEFIAEINLEFKDATHNCYAFKACAPNESSQVGYSDDGEPHGTAGKPMLSCLMHSEIGNIVAVVTRYFGGIKLGTGGLQRAYSSSLMLALDTLSTKEKVQLSQVEISTDYKKINYIHKLLSKFEAKIIKQDYQEKLIITLELPDDQIQNLQTALQEFL